tara:strand:- start:9737 stop:9916 length:180 start_codon:yes stop_codon:yes gene_type:complete
MRDEVDMLDDVCIEMYGHADWEFIDTPKGQAVLFKKHPTKEYLEMVNGQEGEPDDDTKE